MKNQTAALSVRLAKPKYAAEHLAKVLAAADHKAFLTALRDVVEATGGMGRLAACVAIKRPSLYKILSRRGNPTLHTLQQVLKPMGLRISIAVGKVPPKPVGAPRKNLGRPRARA